MKKIYLVLAINLGLLIVQFVLASIHSTDGHTIALLGRQVTDLNFQNHQLARQIYAFSSLAHIQSQAQLLSLSPLETVFFSPLQVAASR